MIRTTAFVSKGRLTIMGIVMTPEGTIPFVHTCRVPRAVKSGVVDFGKDLHPAVKRAALAAKKPIMRKINSERLSVALEETVERAREGDQNAVAILCMVRRNAQKGDPVARSAYAKMMHYAKKSAEAEAQIAGEGDFGWSFKLPLVGKVSVSNKGIRVTTSKANVKAIKAIKKGVTTVGQHAAAPLRIGATAASLVPGVGTTIAVTIGAAAALAEGQSITDAAISAAASALPGGPLVKGIAVTAADGVIKGKRIDHIAANVAKRNAATAVKQFLPDVPGVPNVEKLLSKGANLGELVKFGAKYAGDEKTIRTVSKIATKEGKRALQVGFAMGKARAIQTVRKPDTPISVYSKVAGWELGE